MDTNALYYGDNLEILRKYIPDNSIDLIYLDPPFSSKRDYNILFKESDKWSEAQIKAFSDTWHWTEATEKTYQDIILSAPLRVGRLVEAMVNGIGRNDVMAYLVMMTIRLQELHRVLKDTGSLYLHCDPTASHYLKLILDQIFGPTNFRNEIVWKRTSAHSSARRYGPVHDILLLCTKSDQYTWNPLYQPYSEEYVETTYRHKDRRGAFKASDLTGDGIRHGDSGKPWRGIDPTSVGRHWAVPEDLVKHLAVSQKTMTTQEKLDLLESVGYIYWPKKGKKPLFKNYLNEMPGLPVQDVIIDIPPSSGGERLGYETQKPLALLERIIQASSNEGDIVFDPFCGCGTAVVAAHKLKRRWIGIDITHLAIAVMRHRLETSFPGIQLKVIGEPQDVAGARALARQDRYQFQWWALSLVQAQPLGEKKKGADKGIDGVKHFFDDQGERARRAVISVKSGHIGVKDIRELKAVAEKEAFGILITLEPPTRDMVQEAAAAGFYHSPLWDKDYPKIQILTIEELFQGKTINMPLAHPPYPAAPKIAVRRGRQLTLKENEADFET